MTKSEMLDNIDGVLSDISHLLDQGPTDWNDTKMTLNSMKRTLARLGDALQFSEVTPLPFFEEPTDD